MKKCFFGLPLFRCLKSNTEPCISRHTFGVRRPFIDAEPSRGIMRGVPFILAGLLVCAPLAMPGAPLRGFHASICITIALGCMRVHRYGAVSGCAKPASRPVPAIIPDDACIEIGASAQLRGFAPPTAPAAIGRNRGALTTPPRNGQRTPATTGFCWIC